MNHSPGFTTAPVPARGSSSLASVTSGDLEEKHCRALLNLRPITQRWEGFVSAANVSSRLRDRPLA